MIREIENLIFYNDIFFFLKTYYLINNNKPAIEKTENNKISNIVFFNY